jgi:hypothetical protein
MNSKNVQDIYLQTLIESKPIKHRRVLPSQPVTDTNKSEESMLNHEVNEISMQFKINHTYTYYLKIQGPLFLVCKNIFMKLHGISLDHVRRILIQNKIPEDYREES